MPTSRYSPASSLAGRRAARSVARRPRQCRWRESGAFRVGEARLPRCSASPWRRKLGRIRALFDWKSRVSVPGAHDALPCPLGLAVRQFFLQGGARAWILRCGNPLPLADPKLAVDEFRELQLTALGGPMTAGADAQPILPGFNSRSSPADPLDRPPGGAWRRLRVDDAAMLLIRTCPT